MRTHKSDGRAVKFRDIQLEVKEVQANGKFTGYGSVFGVVDSYRETVEKGAFKATLAAIQQRGRPVPVLWQHRSSEPVGVYTHLEEDDHGLYVEGQLLKDDVQLAKEAYALMNVGAVSGLSIGYYVLEDSFNEKDRIRTLKALDLVEISLVTFPANDDARIETVKAKLARGNLPTLPQFERILRELGFSKSQAVAVASKGLGCLLRSESDSPETATHSADIKALSEYLNGFSLPKLN